MKYFLDLFSPSTYEAFSNSDQTVTGFRERQHKTAERITPGDKLICYMTKMSRWVGLLEVVEGPYIDDKEIFYSENDPFVVRFKVNTLVWLPLEKTFPIHEDRVWESLSFTREHSKKSHTWTGKLRGSLAQIDDQDGSFLESLLKEQQSGGIIYEIDKETYNKMLQRHRVKRTDKDVLVTIPDDTENEKEIETDQISQTRESIKVQALLVEIGLRMGMNIWIPRNDRMRVLAEVKEDPSNVLDRLPLNYDETTLRTIEQIDVIWLKGRSIKRAFEVEHTTSIYSGILRMADLLALQPNMEIQLHIVAPVSRRDKVFQELQRPVFSFLDRGPLSEVCTFISYESVLELAEQPHLQHLSDSVVQEYEEIAED